MEMSNDSIALRISSASIFHNPNPSLILPCALTLCCDFMLCLLRHVAVSGVTRLIYDSAVGMAHSARIATSPANFVPLRMQLNHPWRECHQRSFPGWDTTGFCVPLPSFKWSGKRCAEAPTWGEQHRQYSPQRWDAATIFFFWGGEQLLPYPWPLGAVLYMFTWKQVSLWIVSMAPTLSNTVLCMSTQKFHFVQPGLLQGSRMQSYTQ